MIEEWKRKASSNAAVSWLKHLDLYRGPEIRPVDLKPLHEDRHLRSYEGCIYLAERLPEEYRKWSVLYRLGVAP